MPNRNKQFVLAPAIQLTFDPKLSFQERKDASKFYWLRKHLLELPKKYLEAAVRVNAVEYYPDGNVRTISATGTHRDERNEQHSHVYSVVADAVNVLMTFKLVGMDMAGRKLKDESHVAHMVLTAKEERIAWANPQALGILGGFQTGGQTAKQTARREVFEETGWHIPKTIKIFQLRTFHVRGGSTQRQTNMGAYVELNGNSQKDIALLKRLRSHRGGLAEEGEDIRLQPKSFNQFLGHSDLRQKFSVDLHELVKKVEEKGDGSARTAYEKALAGLQKHGKNHLSQKLKLSYPKAAK